MSFFFESSGVYFREPTEIKVEIKVEIRTMSEKPAVLELQTTQVVKSIDWCTQAFCYTFLDYDETVQYGKGIERLCSSYALTVYFISHGKTT